MVAAMRRASGLGGILPGGIGMKQPPRKAVGTVVGVEEIGDDEKVGYCWVGLMSGGVHVVVDGSVLVLLLLRRGGIISKSKGEIVVW
jgi:hypothetical protein